MISLTVGDEYEHNEYGKVEVTKITEHLDEAQFTEKPSGELIFEGGTVSNTYVHFYGYTHGMEGMQEINEFCDAISL